ncbi:predicted protein [Naegleria gruberi]|uniref:Predicted protein n=1 Tax=Naegleria gruberi TaxID=5762 RepID=D2W346_NAEGR|nr:uncharacterized protein NAEGRDRAFT_75818 [Naegleria gruberi]EFC36550.1 predicted protein [Naegleria gruberi]|eukprot:XP_002669294.1 predicted protein [Naegleria gruberi strain NEG-M]
MSSLYGDCIGHILKFLPLNGLLPVILINKTWHSGLTQSVWHALFMSYLEKEMTNVKLTSYCVKLYRKLFGDDHHVIEELLLYDITQDEKKVSNAKKKSIDYHKSLKSYVIGKLIGREGKELKKLIRFPLQKVFGEGDGRRIDRIVAFERKWKKVSEFLNERVSFHKDGLKKQHISNSINEMLMKRVKYDLKLVFKQDKIASFELGRKISIEIASGQLLQRFRVMIFVQLFYQYFDSSLLMSDQLQLITETNEIPIELFNAFTFETFKIVLDFISKYCPKNVQSIRNHIENDTSKDASLKSFLFEKPQRFLGHYLIGKFGISLFADISDGFEYCLAEYRFEIPNFLVDCLVYRTDKIDETKKLDMVDTYSKYHNIPYLNVDFIVQIINSASVALLGCGHKKYILISNIEILLSKIEDDPEIPLIFRITTCQLGDCWIPAEFHTLVQVIFNFSNKVFDENVQPPYCDPLIFISSQLNAFVKFDVQGWVDLFLEFLKKGSKKKFVDSSGRSFENIVMSKSFPSSIREILVDYLVDYE